MNLQNLTGNQHYISQAEQRLNAIDRSQPSKQQRIFAFTIDDRDAPTLALMNTGGEAIRTTLSCLDLFSFDAAPGRPTRTNLESLFQAYEQKMGKYSVDLLRKLREKKGEDVHVVLVNLVAAKFVNFARNPNCVAKMLNTFGPVDGHRFSDPALQASFDSVLGGSRPQELTVCAEFALTPAQYERWLRVLFMLLAKIPGEPLNLFESTLKGLFEGSFVEVQVCEYTDPTVDLVCLLSDRGFNVPFDARAMFAIEFNLCARAFMSIAFCDPQVDAPAGHVRVRRLENDLAALAAFNQRTVYQAAHTVFASHNAPRLRA